MLLTDTKVLKSLIRGQRRSGTLQQRLEDFYGPQASHYDAFRERLLHGRQDLLQQLNIEAGHSVVEMGAGTGRNLAFLGGLISGLDKIFLVDLCPSLLAVAGERYRDNTNVSIVESDVVCFDPQIQVDRIYFSYSLTMIPNWQAAIDNALKILKPGGLLGVVDFYVSNNADEDKQLSHSFLTRKFWQSWFAHDGVNLNPAHLPYLNSVTSCVLRQEMFGKIPYLPFIKAPYYLYIGRKT